MTTDETGVFSFARMASTMSPKAKTEWTAGEALFVLEWVPSPASLTDRDGLGPLYNAVSCAACHFHNGRGAPPPPGQNALALLVRLSRAATGPNGEQLPDPVYGDQLQNLGIAGVPAEGRVTVVESEVTGAFQDGEPFSLRSPKLVIDNLAYGPFADDTLFSARIAQPLMGVGLLEAIADEDLLARVDTDDADLDGISGRANIVTDLLSGTPRLGRFGWKATQPSVEQQTAAAFLGDMGLTSPMHPVESCTSTQLACGAAPNGGEPELSAQRVAVVAAYNRGLAVPVRTSVQDDEVLAGKGIFLAAGCASCHTPSFTTRKIDDAPWLSEQKIWPYTDLLLHDMGEGLADNRPDVLATGREWRTAPLWGLSRTKTVSGHTRYLHDGRARNVLEAVLWHGGEAAASRDLVMSLSGAQRSALVRFIESL